jgi:hypothetical protein
MDWVYYIFLYFVKPSTAPDVCAAPLKPLGLRNAVSRPGTIKAMRFWNLGASCRFAAGPGYPLQ